MAESGSPYAALDPCVHCGFCLPACPTYLATGDENDSPRGRIVLMRALERGELPATDPSLRRHLDACLGCRGCEPACPSGVGYGRGLEAARETLMREAGIGGLGRIALAVFGRVPLWRAAFGAAGLLRATGAPGRLAGPGRFRLGMGMLAASGPAAGRLPGRPSGRTTRRPPDQAARRTAAPRADIRAILFPGCVMSVLFGHVHRATRRVLAANGTPVATAKGTVCCGAIHAHAGDLERARALARRNVSKLGAESGPIVLNSAGCGAMLRDYGHLLGSDEAERVAARVRDVSEVLAETGPRTGSPLPIRVAYDPPCHLLHAQRVHAPVLTMLGAIPGLEVRSLPGAERCCGSAGIYGLTHPEMARDVLADKLSPVVGAVRAGALDAVATGNPGCIMQIGAGLRAAGIRIPVVHPVELLDLAYRGETTGSGPRAGGESEER